MRIKFFKTLQLSEASCQDARFWCLSILILGLVKQIIKHVICKNPELDITLIIVLNNDLCFYNPIQVILISGLKVLQH